MKKNNFLIKQYNADLKKSIKHNYLAEQFSDYNKIFDRIKKVVKKGDYTLGDEVIKFQENIKKITGAKFCLGVGNGTDALYLALKAFNIKNGDEIITTPYTFIATVASIATVGAKPVFVDVKEDYNIDENLIEKAITKKTKAIMPVHWSGRPCEMSKIKSIAKKYNLKIIQDSCHAIMSKYKNKHIINFGDVCTYSMHPLKNLNVWGDGGFMVTNDKKIFKRLELMRNHGLKNRNTCLEFGYNSRLDSVQAAVANYKIKNKLKNITNKRIKNAISLDKILRKNKEITTVKRLKHLKEVFHLYQINTPKRDALMKYLLRHKIDAKVHYPTPIHLQPAAKYLKYKKGDFPIAEKLANTSISLPVHEFVKINQIQKIARLISHFYS
jgi:dTDP-3-amino-2,3,6-trideoxy-4-keto-D-glucose/dTDP-3-amino-3,4,6-trideoxy-alpha-D-glucose/dTDP-2,6-dideoxy-D-kanosamine transaminase